VVFCFLFAIQGNQQNDSAAISRGSNPLRAIKYHSHLLSGILFLFSFQGNQQNDSTAISRGSNPLRAIKDHSHLLGGFLLFICYSGEPTKRQCSHKQGFESPTGYQGPLTFAEWFFAFMLFFKLA